jgi:hypothetical protein
VGIKEKNRLFFVNEKMYLATIQRQQEEILQQTGVIQQLRHELADLKRMVASS